MGCENCCQEPPCPAPQIECDSVAASESKPGPPACAFAEFGTPSDPPKYYLTRTRSWSISLTTDKDVTCDTPGEHYENSFHSTETSNGERVDTCDPVMGLSTSGSKSGEWEYTTRELYTIDGPPDPIIDCTDTQSDSFVPPDHYWQGSGTSGFLADSGYFAWGGAGCNNNNIANGAGPVAAGDMTRTTTSSTSRTESGTTTISNPLGNPACTGGTDLTSNYTYTETLSDEWTPETTEELIERANAALGEYPATWAGSCSAVKNLSEDESSYSLRRFKWRLKHQPTGTCYLKVWLRRRFVPESGPETIEDLEPYTWTGSGNPCFADGTKPPNHEDNLIVGEPAEELEPDTDGEAFIEIAKWSCVPGYEPADDGGVNGYPPEDE